MNKVDFTEVSLKSVRLLQQLDYPFMFAQSTLADTATNIEIDSEVRNLHYLSIPFNYAPLHIGDKIKFVLIPEVFEVQKWLNSKNLVLCEEQDVNGFIKTKLQRVWKDGCVVTIAVFTSPSQSERLYKAVEYAIEWLIGINKI